MISRRLTDRIKAEQIEQSDNEMIQMTNHFINSSDGSEFHEGMAAGLLLAVELIEKTGGSTGLVAATAINAVIARCIQESEKK